MPLKQLEVTEFVMIGFGRVLLVKFRQNLVTQTILQREQIMTALVPFLRNAFVQVTAESKFCALSSASVLEATSWLTDCEPS